MEPRKLTKADIDKVRHIEGFPIATDEDIISLSNAPYYTACPNPFIEEFIRENGTPYDEETDDYHREPFAADVSEGKYDPLYKLHSYPTKVPHKAIVRYIQHYTNPGDVVLDAFCGTGMTGLAAKTCGISEYGNLQLFENNNSFGTRKAVLFDLSPTATYIAHNYNAYVNTADFFKLAESILERASNRFDWFNSTVHAGLGTATPQYGRINYTVWSRVFICPHCGEKIVLWDATVDYDFKKAIGSVVKKFNCTTCGVELDINKLITAKEPVIDEFTGQLKDDIVQVPVLINYTYGGKRYEKVPDEYDIQQIEKMKAYRIETPVPCREIPYMHQTHQRNNLEALGITHEHHMYTKKSLAIYSYLFDEARKLDKAFANRFMFLLSACFNRTTRLVRYMAQHKEKNVGPLSGTLYFPPIFGEINVLDNINARLKKMKDAYYQDSVEQLRTENCIISTQSAAAETLPANSIDYIFVDPPFGDNLMYSELNYFTDMWLRVYEKNTDEAIINKAQNKALMEYQGLMEKCFSNMYRVLKPNRWITIEFHNSQNAVWNAIQETLLKSGFIIADIRTLDKGKGTTKQMTYTSAVKQDLVISAYKPKDSFKRRMIADAGTEETAWSFVRQHLENIPVAVVKNGQIEVIAERQAFLLFDRMVAYHIMNGIPVPLDATDFYRGLDEKFLKRDGMYFLADQVNEYDTARIINDVEPMQFELFVTNEKSAISWLYQQLSDDFGGTQTYAELQPKFMQEVKSVDKYEAMPELSTLLEENFLQDEKGRWYIPDITKEGDVAKLREKNLWKEFEGYMNSKGKLKLFRSEAIRVGFSRLWKDKNYQAIVNIAERLPEQTIQEDPNLLMYYDISLSRV